jgi:hypothetical protein
MDLLNRTFRLNQDTMGLVGEGKATLPVAIPAGSTLTVTTWDEGAFCNCLWIGITILVLKSDIETRGTPVESAEL